LLWPDLGSANAQSASQLSTEVREFVKVDAPVVVLAHVRVVDGTGSAPRADRSLSFKMGRS